MKKTTLCYIENNGRYLMLYRNRKPDDPNEGKWLGIGGKIEEGEKEDKSLHGFSNLCYMYITPIIRNTASNIQIVTGQAIFISPKSVFKGESLE